jgi:hypothetical protein
MSPFRSHLVTLVAITLNCLVTSGIARVTMPPLDAGRPWYRALTWAVAGVVGALVGLSVLIGADTPFYLDGKYASPIEAPVNSALALIWVGLSVFLALMSSLVPARDE